MMITLFGPTSGLRFKGDQGGVISDRPSFFSMADLPSSIGVVGVGTIASATIRGAFPGAMVDPGVENPTASQWHPNGYSML